MTRNESHDEGQRIPLRRLESDKKPRSMSRNARAEIIHGFLSALASATTGSIGLRFFQVEDSLFGAVQDLGKFIEKFAGCER